MAIYFRFKSHKDFQSIAVPGNYIRIGDLKDRIRKDRGLLRDYDVLLYNPQTGQEYDEFATIPRYTSVELRRVPGLPVPTLTDEPLEPPPPSTCTPQVGGSFASNSSTVTTANPQEFDSHDFGEDVFAAPKKVDKKTNGLENGSSCSDCTNGTSGRGSSICESFGQRGFARMTPPVGYICHRCSMPGHFIQHCPTNGDTSYDIRKQKPPTEIQSAPPANDLIPPELHCPVCKALMKDAAFTKCCFRSLCDKCIRDYISTKSACLCGSMKMSVDDIIPNVTLRELINRISESTASSSREKSGSLVHFLFPVSTSVQTLLIVASCNLYPFFSDAGSANNEQAKVISPTLPAVIKEEPKNFLDSNYGVAMEVDEGASKGTLESNKRKLVDVKKMKKERATQDYGTQNCGGMPMSSSHCSNFLGRRLPMGTDAHVAVFGDALLTGLVPQDPSVIHAYTSPDSRRKRVKMSA